MIGRAVRRAARAGRRSDLQWSARRAAWRVAAIVLVTGVLLPPFVLSHATGLPGHRAAIRTWCRACCRLLRVRVRVAGRHEAWQPTLFVCNHISYLDILGLGGVLDATFVAKSDVARWPLIGFLARYARTVFVDRDPRRAFAQPALLRERLEAANSLVLFPEGTTSDGTVVQAFKTTLFSSVCERSHSSMVVSVQPVTLCYGERGGGVPAPNREGEFAWYGDVDLLPHLWNVLGLNGVQLNIRFHEPIRGTGFRSRKCLARYCEKVVREGLAEMRSSVPPLAPLPVGRRANAG